MKKDRSKEYPLFSQTNSKPDIFADTVKDCLAILRKRTEGLEIINTDDLRHAKSDTVLHKGTKFKRYVNPDRQKGGFVAEGVEIGNDVKIDRGAVIFPGAKIGSGSELSKGVNVYAGTVIGRCVKVLCNATIGAETKIGDLATIEEGTVIGDRAVIGASAVLGKGSHVYSNASVKENGHVLPNTEVWQASQN